MTALMFRTTEIRTVSFRLRNHPQSEVKLKRQTIIYRPMVIQWRCTTYFLRYSGLGLMIRSLKFYVVCLCWHFNNSLCTAEVRLVSNEIRKLLKVKWTRLGRMLSWIRMGGSMKTAYPKPRLEPGAFRIRPTGLPPAQICSVQAARRLLVFCNVTN